MLLLATKVWEQRKLLKVCKKEDNKRIPIKEQERKEGNTPYFGANGIQGYIDGYTHDGTNILIAEDGANNVRNYPIKLITGKIWVNNHAHVLKVNTKTNNGNFLVGAIKKINFYRYLVGSSRYKLTAESLNQVKIKIAKQSEQEKIGKLLKNIEKLLTLYAKKSSCLDSCIAYFIRILYDDPQFFKQKNVQNSIIKSFKLDDILIKNNAKNKDLSILNVESISNKKGFISQKEQFDNYQVASKDLSNYYVIHPKDFAYNPSRINVGSIAYKSPNDVKGIVSPLYVSFKCKNDIVLDKYLWHWFKSTNFEHQRVRLSEGGVRDILSFNQLSKMKISIPSFEIQRQTINLLEILIQYKEEVDLKLNNLKLIKNTLLQSMFL